jgi:hypothetical protein
MIGTKPLLTKLMRVPLLSVDKKMHNEGESGKIKDETKRSDNSRALLYCLPYFMRESQ